MTALVTPSLSPKQKKAMGYNALKFPQSGHNLEQKLAANRKNPVGLELEITK